MLSKFLVLMCCVSAASAASNAVVFEGARLIVDARKAPIDGAAFLVENGHIVKVGKKGALKIPAGAARVDLTREDRDSSASRSACAPGLPEGHNLFRGEFHARQCCRSVNRYAYAGVAAVLSMGTDLGDLPFQLRAEQAPGRALLFTAGKGMASPDAGPGNAELKPSAYALNHRGRGAPGGAGTGREEGGLHQSLGGRSQRDCEEDSAGDLSRDH